MPVEKHEEYYRARLEKLSFFLGALAIPSMFLFPVVAPCLLGSLAVVFAFLSKGRSLHMTKKSRSAMILGITAIVMNLIYMGFSVRTMQTLLNDPAGRQQLSDLLYQQYGMTLDELLRQLPGLQ